LGRGSTAHQPTGSPLEKSDEAAGRPGLGIAAACLPAQPLRPDFWGVVLERLARRQLVALTKTPRRLAALTENGLEIRPARLVGRADGEERLAGMEVAVMARRPGAPTLVARAWAIVSALRNDNVMQVRDARYPAGR
jgi:hypothetical protein